MSTIVVVGSINTDLVVRVPNLPRPGETVLGGRFRSVAGGKGANQAVAAARAGSTVSLLACVGDDLLGARAVEGLREAGVGVGRIQRVSETPSGVALIVVDADGRNAIAVAPGANSRLRPWIVRDAEPFLAAAAVVLVQLEIPLDTVVETVALASSHGARVILDPAPARTLPDEVWQQLAVVTPNETEAGVLTGRSVESRRDAVAAARVLLGRGVGAVIVTLGADGALVATPRTTTHLDGWVVEVVDTTAAGDTFAGTLAAALADGAALTDAARFANAAAALAVTKMGAQPSVPTHDEIARMLRRTR